MKVGINLLLWTFHPTAAEHGSLLAQIKGWGFDGVEFPVAPMSIEECRELGQRCDDLGLGTTALLAFGADVADPINPDQALRRAAVDMMKESIDKTRALGADVLCGPMFQGLGRFTGQAPTEQEWQWCQDVTRKAAQHAAGQHITLAIEPLNRFEMYLVNTLADGGRFCKELDMPNVGLLADTHHSNIEEEQPAQVWAEQIGHIAHVHISENHRGIPGSGHATGLDIYRSLRQGGYDDWLVIESFGQNVKELLVPLHIWRPFFDREEDVAVQGLAHIKKSWQQAG